MATHVVRRLYVYAAAFIGLQMLAAGACGLISIVLERLFVPATLAGPRLDMFGLTTSIPLLVVWLPMWAIHWYFSQPRLTSP